ncbi:hypothetical protein [Flavobacterium sp.]|uniref:hypothetical protein n=1 Tax=Flavobacterium sp. TaxID=239 RepID=UPI003D09CA24
MVQGGVYAVTQGVLSLMQGGEFKSAAVAGFFGSLGASAFNAIAPVTAHSAVGTIGFGAISGGIGAALTDGNFWEGVVIGGMVSGLNHAMHKIDQRRTLLSRFKNKSLAFQKADVSDAGIANLHDNVDGLSLAHKDGGSPAHAFDADGSGEYATTTETTVHLNKSLLSTKNNLFFAGVLFHEYRHSFQYHVPYTVGGKTFKSRVDAYLSRVC